MKPEFKKMLERLTIVGKLFSHLILLVTFDNVLRESLAISFLRFVILFFQDVTLLSTISHNLCISLHLLRFLGALILNSEFFSLSVRSSILDTQLAFIRSQRNSSRLIALGKMLVLLVTLFLACLILIRI
jgi:hypothetical protein